MDPAQDLWVIDTSSVIAVRELRKDVQREAYRKLSDLAERGTLLFPLQVLDELKRIADPSRPDPPLKWATENKAKATCTPIPFEIVREVLAEVDDLLDYEKPTPDEEADPYVLALAVELQQKGHRVTVITEDRRDRPGKTSLATACGVFHVPSLPVRMFLKRQGVGE